MNRNACPKSNKFPVHPRQANSGSFCPGMTNPAIHPARGLMICLGWLRLYQTVLSNKSRTSHARVFHVDTCSWRVRFSNHLMKCSVKNRRIGKSDEKQMVGFTSGEHLGVQEQIERRARELWFRGGCRHGTALNDWVQAEREVLERFILACARRHSLPQSLVGVARSKPETRIQKRGRTITARHLPSASALATFPL
jgi:hypothetical protein